MGAQGPPSHSLAPFGEALGSGWKLAPSQFRLWPELGHSQDSQLLRRGMCRSALATVAAPASEDGQTSPPCRLEERVGLLLCWEEADKDSAAEECGADTRAAGDGRAQKCQQLRSHSACARERSPHNMVLPGRGDPPHSDHQLASCVS